MNVCQLSRCSRTEHTLFQSFFKRFSLCLAVRLGLKDFCNGTCRTSLRSLTLQGCVFKSTRAAISAKLAGDICRGHHHIFCLVLHIRWKQRSSSPTQLDAGLLCSLATPSPTSIHGKLHLCDLQQYLIWTKAVRKSQPKLSEEIERWFLSMLMVSGIISPLLLTHRISYGTALYDNVHVTLMPNKKTRQKWNEFVAVLRVWHLSSCAMEYCFICEPSLMFCSASREGRLPTGILQQVRHILQQLALVIFLVMAFCRCLQ